MSRITLLGDPAQSEELPRIVSFVTEAGEGFTVLTAILVRPFGVLKVEPVLPLRLPQHPLVVSPSLCWRFLGLLIRAPGEGARLVLPSIHSKLWIKAPTRPLF